MADKTWTVVVTKEQSILDDNGTNRGNSKSQVALVGTGTTARTFRELLYAPLFGEWPADMYQLKEAWLDLTGRDTWALLFGLTHGSDPQINIRIATEFWQSTGGSTGETISSWAANAVDSWPGPTMTSTIDPGHFASNYNALKSIDVATYIERILDPGIKKRDGTPGTGTADHGIVVKAEDESTTEDRWGFRTIRDTQAARWPKFRIIYDPKIPPGVPTVLSPEPGGNPTVVGSTNARNLPVEYVATLAAGDTADRNELEVYADGADANEDDPGSQIVLGTRIATTGAVATTATGSVNTFRVTTTLPVSAIRQQVLYRLRVRSQKGVWSRWTALAEGRIQSAYIPGVPDNPFMTKDPQNPIVSATLHSQDTTDFVTAVRATFVRHNSDGSTTNLWPNLGTIAVGGATTRPLIQWGGIGLNDGDVVSWTISLANQDGVFSPYTAEQTTVMQTSLGPTFDPADSSEKLLSRTGPIVINDTVEFDAYRYRLYRNDVLIYSSPITASGPDDTASITLPTGYLNWGDTFGIEAETRPTNTTEFGPTSPRATLYIDTLPSVGEWEASVDDFTGPVLPDANVTWHSEYDDPDAERFGEVPEAKEIEWRHYAAVPTAGALLDRRTNLSLLKAIDEDESSGETLHLLTTSTSFVGDTNVTPTTVASAPATYSGNSLRLTLAASSVDRGARYTFPDALDLTGYGSQVNFLCWERHTSVTNLVDIRVRLESTGGGWVEWAIADAADTVNVWRDSYSFLGAPDTASGTMDWSSVTGFYLWANVSGSYSGSIDFRDMVLGNNVWNTTTPDWTWGFEPETSYNSRVRYRDDADPVVDTTLAATSAASATNVKVTSVTGFVIGQDLTLGNDSTVNQETRTITAVGTSGSGGTGITVSEGYLFSHGNGTGARVFPWGPWSSWLTVGISDPPVVAATSPADAATVTDPTPDFVHTFTSPAGKLQAFRTLRIFKRTDGVDRQVYETDTVGTGLTDTGPVLLLEDGLTYAWEVVGYDTDGLYGTTTRRTFTTDFTAPAAITNLAATTDPVGSTVTLTWTASADTHFQFYVVRYIGADGQPQRIDLGPREVDDDREPLTDETFTFRGARLGDSTFRVTAHNGAQESDLAEVDANLAASRGGASMLVIDDATGRAYANDLTGAPRIWEPIVERFPVPGRRYPAHFHWGTSARRVTWRCTYVPSEDPSLERAYGSLTHLGTAVYLKLPPGYDWDVMRARGIAGPTATPQQAGLVDLSTDFDEIAPEVPA